MSTKTAKAPETKHATEPRAGFGLPPLTARQWSDTATNYRDMAALFSDFADAREAARHETWAARYSARAFEAWRDAHDAEGVA